MKHIRQDPFHFPTHDIALCGHACHLSVSQHCYVTNIFYMLLLRWQLENASTQSNSLNSFLFSIFLGSLEHRGFTTANCHDILLGFQEIFTRTRWWYLFKFCSNTPMKLSFHKLFTICFLSRCQEGGASKKHLRVYLIYTDHCRLSTFLNYWPYLPHIPTKTSAFHTAPPSAMGY